MRFRRHRLSALAIFAVLACSEPTRPPSPTVDWWILQTVGGASLPAPVFPDATVDVLSSRIVLRADGTGEHSRVLRQLGDTVEEKTALTWTLVADRLEVSLRCDDTLLALCVAPPHFAGPVTGQLGNRTWALDHAVLYSLPVVFHSAWVPPIG